MAFKKAILKSIFIEFQPLSQQLFSVQTKPILVWLKLNPPKRRNDVRKCDQYGIKVRCPQAPWEILTHGVSTRKVPLGYAKCSHTFIHRCIASTHLKAKRLCESLAKTRVWPWLCKAAAGVRRISKKGKITRMKVHAGDLIFTDETFQPPGAQNTHYRGL